MFADLLKRYRVNVALDGWNLKKHRDSEDLRRRLESRHHDLRRRTSDFGDFNGLLGSAYAQEKCWNSYFTKEIRDSKDTRDSSYSAKSSRHFESRSSLHVSDQAALTIFT